MSCVNMKINIFCDVWPCGVVVYIRFEGMHCLQYQSWTFFDSSRPVLVVFVRSNTGIVGSNPTQGMDACLRLFCVCVGSDLATGWSPVQGVLPTVLGLTNWSERKRFTDALCSKVGATGKRERDRFWDPVVPLANGCGRLFAPRWSGQADHSPPNSAQVKNAWIHTSTPSSAFMLWCLTKTGTNIREYYKKSTKVQSPSH
jgi:hypothetical protein